MRAATGAARTSAIFGPGMGGTCPATPTARPKRRDGPITAAVFRVPRSEALFRFFFCVCWLVLRISLRYGLGNSAAIDNAIILTIVISTYLQSHM